MDIKAEKNKTLENFAYFFLPSIGEFIWNCNVNVIHASSLMSRKGFWYNVLTAWCHYNFEEKTDIDSIMESPLWLNSELLIFGKPMVSKKCMEHNIIYIKDLMVNNRFMTFDEFTTNHGNVLNFLKYYGILKAISQ